jgi:hypothetical protein
MGPGADAAPIGDREVVTVEDQVCAGALLVLGTEKSHPPFLHLNHPILYAEDVARRRQDIGRDSQCLVIVDHDQSAGFQRSCNLQSPAAGGVPCRLSLESLPEPENRALSHLGR